MSKEIKNQCRSLELSDNLLQEVMKRLDDAITAGLKKETHPEAVVKCFPTFVHELPKGNEEGEYLALDLGGTNFRVLMISCESKGCRMEFETFPLSTELMTGPGNELFDYIAKCLSEFTHSQGVQNKELGLGFTFSFPVVQTGLTDGKLVRWTKGFKCEGVEGEDVSTLLKEAVDRRDDLNLAVVALLNDTTGCLVSCSYEHKDCKVGVIVGTGFNACYVEKCQNVTNFDNKLNKPFIIINCEWGAFGSDGALDFVLTEFDRIVDERSLNPGQQIFEKMVAGMYMGELVRLVMEKCTKEGILFGGKGSEKLFTPGSFTTKDISRIESTQSGNLGVCNRILQDQLDLPHATAQDCLDIHYICSVVSTRSAHLASAGIACLINRTDFKDITVGVDGSVYRYHPHYHTRLTEKIPSLLTTPRTLNIVLSQDGSGRGAAFVAAVAAAEKKEEEKKEMEEKENDEKRKQRHEYEKEIWNQQNPLLDDNDKEQIVRPVHQPNSDSQQKQNQKQQDTMQNQQNLKESPNQQGAMQKQQTPMEDQNQQQLLNLQQTLQNLTQSIQNLQQSMQDQKLKEQQNKLTQPEEKPNEKQLIQKQQKTLQDQQEHMQNLQKSMLKLQQSIQNLQQSIQDQKLKEKQNKLTQAEEKPNEKQLMQKQQETLQDQLEHMQNLKKSMLALQQSIQNLQQSIESQQKTDQQPNRSQSESMRNQQQPMQNQDEEDQCQCCEIQVTCDCDS